MSAIELVQSTYVIKSVNIRHHLDEHGEPWFVAKDICEYLDLVDTSSACRKVWDDCKGRQILPTPGGPQEMITVNEPGLYQLIFQSNKSEAVDFQRWVLKDLLPSVRRNGYYRQPGRELPRSGKLGHGRQPFLDEIKRRGISQARALKAMNELKLPGVPLIKESTYGNQCYGGCRSAPELVKRAATLLGMSGDVLFTAQR
jgi:prophage antirepressor-like protein